MLENKMSFKKATNCNKVFGITLLYNILNFKLIFSFVDEKKRMILYIHIVIYFNLIKPIQIFLNITMKVALSIWNTLHNFCVSVSDSMFSII